MNMAFLAPVGVRTEMRYAHQAGSSCQCESRAELETIFLSVMLISPLDQIELPGPYGEGPTLVLATDDGAASGIGTGPRSCSVTFHMS